MLCVQPLIRHMATMNNVLFLLSGPEFHVQFKCLVFVNERQDNFLLLLCPFMCLCWCPDVLGVQIFSLYVYSLMDYNGLCISTGQLCPQDVLQSDFI